MYLLPGLLIGSAFFWLAGVVMVPEASGAWGWLLPKAGASPLSTVTPAGHDNVVEVSSVCLKLVGPFHFLRGYAASVAFAFGIAMALLSVHSGVWYLGPNSSAGKGFLVLWMIYVACALIGLISAYRLVFSPVQETTIVSRKLRRLYAWDKAKGWTHVDYDRVQAFVASQRLVTTTGASQSYALRVVELVEGSRRIAKGVTPTRAFGRPERAAELWEYIRRYMDGDPQDLPPVRLVPDCRVNAYAWMDRELYSDAVDPQHRLTGIYGSLSFWFFSGVYYLPQWMELWIRRYGRRPALPPELNLSMPAEERGLYRVIAPTQEELLAREGKLPYMMKRWRIASVFGVFLWGVMPIFGLVLFLTQ